MIEKPKRPKQPNIQERQPPRVLQELISRYDLDNTKIYDFLDELVNQLNADRETIDSDISSKVNKSGDTLTGNITLNNNKIRFSNNGNVEWKEDGWGDKFRIISDFGGSGTSNKLIIQSTTGGAGTDPSNWTDLVYIHADSGDVELAGDIMTRNSVEYVSWHSVVLTRSDNDHLYIMLYGSNILKKGTYSINNDFIIYTYGTTNSTLTIPTTAIADIIRFDWGFEIIVNRSGITGISSGEYNGVAITGGANIILKST